MEDGGVAVSELSKDPVTTAAERKLTMCLPAENELFVDLDDADSEAHYAAMLRLVWDVCHGDTSTSLRDVKRTVSANGNAHVYLEHDFVWPPGATAALLNIALQACLGSDRKRELLSLLRVLRQTGLPPTVFFERPSDTTKWMPQLHGDVQGVIVTGELD